MATETDEETGDVELNHINTEVPPSCGAGSTNSPNNALRKVCSRIFQLLQDEDSFNNPSEANAELRRLGIKSESSLLWLGESGMESVAAVLKPAVAMRVMALWKTSLGQASQRTLARADMEADL